MSILLIHIGYKQSFFYENHYNKLEIDLHNPSPESIVRYISAELQAQAVYNQRTSILHCSGPYTHPAVTIPSFVGYSHISGPGAGMGARGHVSCLVVQYLCLWAMSEAILRFCAKNIFLANRFVTKNNRFQLIFLMKITKMSQKSTSTTPVQRVQ